MIAGVVTSDLDAVIPVRVRSPTGRDREVEVVIDTGFNGWMSLPSDWVKDLGLPWLGWNDVVLGDGRRERCEVYEATVVWDGRPRQVFVEAAEIAPLVGMALLTGYELTIQVRPGGSVGIRPQA